ncbi:hypothetical protein [Pseudomonas fluorescens]|uniref:Uncharacterized protein n=1 Tax=Pseudomonas fluorescens TaxID=294 RepID=A0A5E7V998_PSEFL|nr:hypothetical protein [Pseudomonas fluorescens]VVQ20592.1 hypothetical protein PS928_05025 [Pseudomonas fluorescens]
MQTPNLPLGKSMTPSIDLPDENLLAVPALALGALNATGFQPARMPLQKSGNGVTYWRRLAKLWHETSSSPAIP